MKRPNRNRPRSGIYGIHIIPTRAYYVGQAIDIDKRIKQHIAAAQSKPKQHIDIAISNME